MASPKLIRSLVLLQCTYSMVSSKWIDMSYLYDNETLAWGDTMPFKHTVVLDGRFNEHVPYLSMFNLEMSEHSGTHVDAPLHFAKGKWSVDEIPLERLIGQAIVVNISAKASKDHNAQLTVVDLQMWEKEHGQIPKNCILLVLSGWGKYWPNYEKYFGTNRTNNTFYQFPSISGNASKWIADNREIKAIGIDTASIDSGPSSTYPAHQNLYAKNIYGLESVVNIDKLPPKGATIYVMPMNVKGGSGAPARIIANTRVDVVGRSSKYAANALVFSLVTLVAMCFM